jgi:hypothetical protein
MEFDPNLNNWEIAEWSIYLTRDESGRGIWLQSKEAGKNLLLSGI